MAEILAALATTPLPTILTIAGIFFLLLAVAPISIKGVMVGKPSSKRQTLSGIIGVLLLLGGVSLFWAATIKSTSPIATETPLPPTIDTNLITNTPPFPLNTLTPTIEIVSPIQIFQSTTGVDIAITEVMAVPCGNTTGPSANEFIEIYNYGTVPADVNGWWIVTNNLGNGISPDKIVSWDMRNSGLLIGSKVVTNTTIIPPSGYAVILPPKYFTGDANIRMPYIFPESTIILTVDTGEYLGDDNFGLTGTSSPLSVIVLYIGTSNIIDKVISTYGSPKYGASPENISDNDSDKIPFSVGLCYSVERISASGPDSESNWRKLKDGSPGFGDYR